VPYRSGWNDIPDRELVLLQRGDHEMTDETPPPAAEPAEDLRNVVIYGVKDAADRVSSAINEGRKPGRSLDILAKVTRDAPLGALLVAFLFGAAMGRRRHW
jgi:hypothetical protein